MNKFLVMIQIFHDIYIANSLQRNAIYKSSVSNHHPIIRLRVIKVAT